jgi:outer membrane protein
MKNNILKSLSLVALLFVFSQTNAQKVGHLNFQKVIELLPEFQTASDEYQLFQTSLEDELTQIEVEAKKTQSLIEIEQKKPQPSAPRLKLLAQKMEKYQVSYQEISQTIQESLKEKYNELIDPLKEKVSVAVAEVAKENGYTHVMDANSLIYADEKFDLEALVKAKLNIKDKPALPPVKAPGTVNGMGTGR